MAVLLATSAALGGGSPSIAAEANPEQPPLAFFVETAYLASYDHAVLWVDQVIDPTSIPDPSDFTVEIDQGFGPITEPAVDVDFVYQGLVGSPIFTNELGWTAGTAFLEVRWATPAPADAWVHLTYTPGAHPIRGLDGQTLEGFSQTLERLDAADFIALIPFVDEGAGPDTLVLFFPQPMGAQLPDRAAFDVTVNGGPPADPVGISRRAAHLGGTFIYLDLAGPVAPGDTVRVGYTAAETATPLLDRNGDVYADFPDAEVFVSLSATPTRQTDPGLGVSVSPADSATGAQLATIGFENVTVGGITTLTTTAAAPELPAGFSLGDPPTFYDIDTTATFEGEATVCIRYGAADYDDPSSLRLLHHDGTDWVDVTTNHDAERQTICGRVTSFSPFAVVEPLPVAFDGFYRPVDNPPTYNTTQAGSAVPVKFSLGGDLGLDIFADASPASRRVSCDPEAPLDTIEETVTSSANRLTYDAGADQYNFVWKTDRAWANTCRELTLTFLDGTQRTLLFRFA